MRKLNTEAELKKSVAYKKSLYMYCNCVLKINLVFLIKLFFLYDQNV